MTAFGVALDQAAARFKEQAPGCFAGAFRAGAIPAGDAMTVDMKWRDAMTVRCIAGAFAREEHAAGWPDQMDARQLAVMQRAYDSGDSKGRKLVNALHEALYACRDE